MKQSANKNIVKKGGGEEEREEGAGGREIGRERFERRRREKEREREEKGERERVSYLRNKVLSALKRI